MASTLTTNPSAGDSVWVITTATTTCVSALRSGAVIQVIAIELTSGTSYAYDIRLTNENGTTRIDAANIFASLEEATIEYFIRLGGTTVAGSPPMIVTPAA